MLLCSSIVCSSSPKVQRTFFTAYCITPNLFCQGVCKKKHKHIRAFAKTGNGHYTFKHRDSHTEKTSAREFYGSGTAAAMIVAIAILSIFLPAACGNWKRRFIFSSRDLTKQKIMPCCNDSVPSILASLQLCHTLYAPKIRFLQSEQSEFSAKQVNVRANGLKNALQNFLSVRCAILHNTIVSYRR